MLTSLKDKLLAVTKNVSLFSPDENIRKANNKSNPRAGSIILQHYQNSWCELHCLNEDNANRADVVAGEIKSISEKVSSSRENIGLITHVLTNSGLTNNISQCLNQVKEIYSTCEVIEQKLIELEDVINEVEFQNMKKQHIHHLESYRLRKNESLKHLKQSLEDSYQSKLKEHELGRKSVLEERQKVFQEAFKTDLETYKHLGTIPKVDLPKHQNGAILEEIQLDFDQNELERFFEDENDKNGAQ